MPIKLFISLGGLIASAWAYLFYQSWQMTHLPMSQMWMPPSQLVAWPLPELLGVFAMWAIMMAAMMLPSVLPMLNAFNRYCLSDPKASPWHSLYFGGSYLAVWIGFSAILTAMQWLFHGLAWLSPMMENKHTYLAATIFIIAGVYQFSSFKNACLQHCRTPFGYILNEWRPGRIGALQMGFKHGLSCLGCCWAQMLIMFAVGVMNLTGMILITGLVCLEKTSLIDAKKLSYSSGSLFLLWGIYWLFARP